jgi:hypothetical protein
LIGSGKFLGAASFKGRKQPAGLVILRELRVLCRWTHDLPNEMTSTHRIRSHLVYQLGED